MTVWRDEDAMRAYGASGAHCKAAPLLMEWGDRASVCHWTQHGGDLPEWPEAVQLLREKGRPLRLKHPAPDRAEHRVAAPKMTFGMRL